MGKVRIPVKLRRQVSVTQFCTAPSCGLVAKMEEAKYAVQDKVNSFLRVNFLCQKQWLLGEWRNKWNISGYCEGSEQCPSSLYWGNHRHDQVWRKMALNEYLEKMINWVHHLNLGYKPYFDPYLGTKMEFLSLPPTHLNKICGDWWV